MRLYNHIAIRQLFRDFEVRGFWPALVLAVAMTIAGSLPDGMYLN